MGSLHVFSLLRRPLPLLVTSLVFIGVFCSSSGAAALCEKKSCCLVLPSCEYALDVRCNCTNTMTLRKGDIPADVRTVEIVNTSHVIINKDTISGLRDLTSFSLSNVSKVEIQKDGMFLHESSSLRSVKIENVIKLQIKRKAFSGVLQKEMTIDMISIGNISVESKAFDYNVTEVGPNILLNSVDMLNLEGNGFASQIFLLNMINVTMDECHNGSFSGNTYHTEFKNVSITQANPGCFFVQNNNATFNFKFLTMENVYPQAFLGNMFKLIIEESRFTKIQSKGFEIRVTKMQIKNSLIKDLQSKGLSVIAKESILLEHLEFCDLRRNALSGLRIEKSSSGVTQRLLLNQFQIKRAEDGFLALSDLENLQNFQMNNMHVMFWMSQKKVDNNDSTVASNGDQLVEQKWLPLYLMFGFLLPWWWWWWW